MWSVFVAIGGIVVLISATWPSVAVASGAAQASAMTADHSACLCDYTGAAVATSGSLLAVGVPGIDDAAGRVYVYTLTSGAWTQSAELVGSDTASGDYFGDSVAISGTTILVGAEGHARYAGSAYVFDQNGSSWSQVAELVGKDTSTGDWFGGSVALDGTTAVVGAPGRAGDVGAAYTFTATGGTWNQTGELAGPGPRAELGYAVAVSGSTAVIGAPGNPGGKGSVDIYTYNSTTWSVTSTLQGTNRGAHDFGSSVAVDGSTVAVGSWVASAGAAYVYTGSGGTWTQSASFDDSGRAHGLGAAVAVSGGTVVVSAVGSSGNGGTAYVFGNTSGAWTQGAVINPSGPENGTFFGNRSLSISGGTLAVGAPAHGTAGDAFVFSQVGGAWTQTADLSASDSNALDGTGSAVAISSFGLVAGAPGHDGTGRGYLSPAPPPYHPVVGLQGADTSAGDMFGYSVGESGTTVIVGAPAHGGSGSAYIATQTPSGAPYTQAAVRSSYDAYVYEQPVEIMGSDTSSGDKFGASVSISGSTAVVGAPGHGNGTAYVFDLTAGGWSQVAELSASDGSAGGAFGTSVSISGTAIVVGAPDQNGTGTAYVYNETNGSWTQGAELVGSGLASGDDFGSSVAVDGTTVVVGAPEHAGTGVGYVFSGSGDSWSQVSELSGSDSVSGDAFGSSVAVAGTTAIVGAPGHTGGGAGYVLSGSNGTWTQSEELKGSDTTAGDEFGASVAIAGSTAAVGAPGARKGVGSAYEFSI
jgi:hypothetical protein